MGARLDATAMSEDSGTSIGAWVAPPETAEYGAFDSADLERFDDTMKLTYSGSYSRSHHMKQAMGLYLAVHDRIADLEEWPDPAEVDDLERFVAGALRDAYRQDVEDRDR